MLQYPSFIIFSARVRSILSVGSVQYGGPGRVLYAVRPGRDEERKLVALCLWGVCVIGGEDGGLYGRGGDAGCWMLGGRVSEVVGGDGGL